jgi:hypothetical protein
MAVGGHFGHAGSLDLLRIGLVVNKKLEHYYNGIWEKPIVVIVLQGSQMFRVL